MSELVHTSVARYIDHTVLKPTTSPEDVSKCCREAQEHQFAAVCIPPNYVALARKLLDKGLDSGVRSAVKVATVIGFPFGYSATAAKLAEIEVTDLVCRRNDEAAVLDRTTAPPPLLPLPLPPPLPLNLAPPPSPPTSPSPPRTDRWPWLTAPTS